MNRQLTQERINLHDDQLPKMMFSKKNYNGNLFSFFEQKERIIYRIEWCGDPTLLLFCCWVVVVVVINYWWRRLLVVGVSSFMIMIFVFVLYLVSGR